MSQIRFTLNMSGFVLVILLLHSISVAAEKGPQVTPSKMERSYWVHASLGLFTQKGHLGSGFPETTPPIKKEVENAARLLSGFYGANRLYLIYHKEMSVEDARRVFLWWRASCPKSMEIVPALVMRVYDEKETPVFTADQVQELVDFFYERINSECIAVYDIYPKRDQTKSLESLAKRFPNSLIRLGQQPGEKIAPPFAAAVQNTWSGFCHGTKNKEDRLQPGPGAEILREWVEERNTGDCKNIPGNGQQ